ncbi:hypothetical protein [Microcoleus sp. Pol12B4]|uniref:hypothetical protein n=1 Tax=Microcoleus sp. Pol12B4 TaxID=3055395 RepID=UPI002FD18042
MLLDTHAFILILMRSRGCGELSEFKNKKAKMKQFKIISEKHFDGYVAYALGIKGAVVSEGDTYEEALADVKAAIRCYIEVFGKETMENESPAMRLF